ncbi:MAG: quinone-dependent dihydroorotate dehydrogenase [Patescibacteria group bacterium]
MFGFFYKTFLKPVLFLFDAESVHEAFLNLGEFFGRSRFLKQLIRKAFAFRSEALGQQISGIKFENPVGLAAGFDYQAKLTQILPSLGFGFETIGTITNQKCQGNSKPRLGRLPKSKSLMVNKGFKNPGVDSVIKKLSSLGFVFPLGISIGVTNSEKIETLEQAIQDVVAGFEKFLNSPVKNSYYELNISCPNLKTKINFYNSENLNALLLALSELKIQKPVFVKMPISNTDKEILAMLEVLKNFSLIKGVIFGNLQKNRADPALNQAELKKFSTGNFSGKPTEKRSNELIALAYKNYQGRFIIIGCGGVFSAEGAYKKIKLGANLVQLITGLVFQGPQLVSGINRDLVKLLKRDGFENFSQAIGAESSELGNGKKEL